MVTKQGYLVLLATLLAASPAQAGFGTLVPAERKRADLHRIIDVHGYLRTRAEVMHNFDLNRGPTPTTGAFVFPLPDGHPATGEALYNVNMRLRLAPVIRVGDEVAVYFELDLLDNLILGSTPEGLPATAWVPTIGGSTRQNAPSRGDNWWQDSIVVRSAWGETLTPFGVFMAGRMPSEWGLGILANAGNGLDDDGGDRVDRVAFVTSLLGHLWALSFDWNAIGATAWRHPGQALNLEPGDDLWTLSFGFLQYHSDLDVARRGRAGRVTVDYGLSASYRHQALDLPSLYLQGNMETDYTAAEYVRRDLWTLGLDGYLRILAGPFRLEGEFIFLLAEVGNASLVPGIETAQAYDSLQYGGVIQGEWRFPFGLDVGVEVGLASGDSAPGFGVAYPIDQPYTQPGDLDGPQVRLPHDLSANNLRFHPCYHVDLILWRQIIGAVTDAFYVRPHIRYWPTRDLAFEVKTIYSMALYPTTPPGGQRPLGVEVDPALVYRSGLGFDAALEYGALFPLAGLDNPLTGQRAGPAQTVRARVAFRF